MKQTRATASNGIRPYEMRPLANYFRALNYINSAVSRSKMTKISLFQRQFSTCLEFASGIVSYGRVPETDIKCAENYINDIARKARIVAERSRLGREMLQVLNIINDLSAKSVEITFMRQPELSTKNSHGELLLAIYSYFAEAERAFISLWS